MKKTDGFAAMLVAVVLVIAFIAAMVNMPGSIKPTTFSVTLTEEQRDSICNGSTHVNISEIQIKQQ